MNPTHLQPIDRATTSKRRKKLIEPRLQLRFALVFGCVAAVAVICQALIATYLFTSLASELPNDKNFVLAKIPSLVALGVVGSTALLLPLCAALGIITTFPIVGPLYRFRVFLASVIAGKEFQPCAIRESDELQDICALLNEVTSAERERIAAVAGEENSESIAA